MTGKRITGRTLVAARRCPLGDTIQVIPVYVGVLLVRIAAGGHRNALLAPLREQFELFAASTKRRMTWTQTKDYGGRRMKWMPCIEPDGV